MMERRPLVAIGRKATDRIRDTWLINNTAHLKLPYCRAARL